jgi:hypothetical protein
MHERLPLTTDREIHAERKIFGLALPAVLLAIACLLNKAYTIDDPPFLLGARQILETPPSALVLYAFVGRRLEEQIEGGISAG